MDIARLVFTMSSISRVKALIRESNADPRYVEAIVEFLDKMYYDINASVDEVQSLMRTLRQIEKEGAKEPGTLAYSMSQLARDTLNGVM